MMKNLKLYENFSKGITIELEIHLNDTFKSNPPKEKYEVVIDRDASKDEHPVHVAIGYDVATKSGYTNAKDDVFFDLDDQAWFDNNNDGGEVKSLDDAVKIVKNHIRDNKKSITG